MLALRSPSSSNHLLGCTVRLLGELTGRWPRNESSYNEKSPPETDAASGGPFVIPVERLDKLVLIPTQNEQLHARDLFYSFTNLLNDAVLESQLQPRLTAIPANTTWGNSGRVKQNSPPETFEASGGLFLIPADRSGQARLDTYRSADLYVRLTSRTPPVLNIVRACLRLTSPVIDLRDTSLQVRLRVAQQLFRRHFQSKFSVSRATARLPVGPNSW